MHTESVTPPKFGIREMLMKAHPDPKILSLYIFTSPKQMFGGMSDLMAAQQSTHHAFI